MTDGDRELLIRAHSGHEPSARLLWERHGPRLVAYARAVAPQFGAAEDIVQSVFCRLIELDRRALRAILDVRAYLTTLTRNEALNAARAARRERARRGHTQPPSATAKAHDDELAAALAELPRHLREVVVLRHVQELTFDQIEAATGINRNTAASRYKVAMARLRARLDAPASAPSTETAHA